MIYIFYNHAIGYHGLLGYYMDNIPLWLSLICLLVYTLIPYMLGSINTAVIVSKVMYNDDIRNYGSGNAGFTNVMRTFGTKAAAITFVGDIMKTVVSVSIGWCFFGYLSAYIAGFACFIGHILPCFYQFRGGKGVLCAASMMFMIDWRLFLVVVGVFVLSVAVTKYISFGSVMGAMVFPLLQNRLNNASVASLDGTRLYMVELLAMAIGIIVVIKHKENLKRIFSGTESKFSFKKSKKKEETDSSEAENG